MLELEERFTVPKKGSVNQKGEIGIKFSTPLKDLEYDLIEKKFLWLLGNTQLRQLKDEVYHKPEAEVRNLRGGGPKENEEDQK